MSETKDDGGPAFPQHGWSDDPGTIARTQDKLGMSLRDYFAGLALGHIPELLRANDANRTSEIIAKWAYEIADEMLKARTK